jgi:hypothetical protein
MPGGTSFTPFTEGLPTAPNPADMVPVDSYDFTGLPLVSGGTPQFTTSATAANEWYYIRPSPMAGDSRKSWHFVYPGHIAVPTYKAPPPNPIPRLIDGTIYTSPGASSAAVPAGISQALLKAQNIANATKPLPSPQYTLPLGANSLYTGGPSDEQNGVATLTYKDIPLELNNADFGGPNAGRTNTALAEPNEFPFGGFPRNGDILEVPYIGAYRLMIQAGVTWQTIEMNPVTMDSVMALGLAQSAWNETLPTGALEPTTTPPNPNGADPIYGILQTRPNPFPSFAIEQVGRFCPLGPAEFPPGALPVYTNAPNDYFLSPNPASPASPTWLYHWATRLFDYLTVQSPQQDFLPDVDPGVTDPNVSNTITPNPPPSQYMPGVPTAVPQSVSNVAAGVFNGEPLNPPGQSEEAATVEGLVNINTAPWRVLAAVPWVPPTSMYPNHAVDNANIAVSIAYYRDVNDGSVSPPAVHPHGPFKSIFELGSVPIYAPIGGSDVGAPGKPLRDFLATSVGLTPPVVTTADQGDLTQVYTANSPNPVVGDFKYQYMMINRVSNLVTTRSDSFTAYILLQGWRNAETPGATLAVQRRAAFLIDRSGITPINNNSPTVNFVPNQ